ncbi:MAG: hypothetical protein ABJK25_00255 [Halieaceae bacterium]
MQDMSELLSIAEIAVTIAGFSALVSILAWRRENFDPKAEGLRLILALEASLFVALFSALPLVPHKFGMDGALVWRVCAIVYLLSDIAFAILMTKRTKNIDRFWPSVLISRVLWGISLLGQILLALAAIGFPEGTAHAWYFSALFLNLINSGLLFLVVAWNTFVPK